jgi:SAM-dependent methyltransferase
MIASPAAVASYWHNLASSYPELRWPLRPSSEDVRFMEAEVAAWAAAHSKSRLHMLLLGVTPEIADMQVPAGSSLTAVDSSMAMVRAVWPGSIPRKRQASCGNWLALPIQDSSCSVAIGDGSMNCLPYPDGYRQLAAEVCRVLSDDGILILRCYIQPAVQERPDDVWADIFREPIPSFHHFKFRLLMAMQQCPQAGIAVDEVYRYWARRNLDTGLLTSRAGWEQSAIDTIELYRDSATVHTFPTLVEYQSVLDEFFDEISLTSTPCNLGERCPILVLKPRPLHNA